MFRTYAYLGLIIIPLVAFGQNWKVPPFGWGVQTWQGYVQVDSSLVATQADLLQGNCLSLVSIVTGVEPYMEIACGDVTYRIVLTVAGPSDTLLDLQGDIVTGAEPYWQISYNDTLYQIVLTPVP